MHMLVRSMLALLLLLSPLAMLAATPREALLVSSDWLATHLKDPDLVLLHVGDPKDYAAKHIPGARLISYDHISTPHEMGKSLMLELPPAEVLRANLEKLGISDGSRIVVYYGKDWVSPATRAVFTFDAIGLGARTSLLDGGMAAWVRAGHETTDAATPPATGRLSPLKLQDRIVDAGFVQSHLGKPGYVVIDGRAASLYDGIETGGDHDHPHKTGHVAGAQSLPFNTVTNTDLTFKSADDLAAMFAKAGAKPGDVIVGYCHIGQQATAMLFAARTLGYEVRLYDGSFEDWSARDLPVVNPAKAGAGS